MGPMYLIIGIFHLHRCCQIAFKKQVHTLYPFCSYPHQLYMLFLPIGYLIVTLITFPCLFMNWDIVTYMFVGHVKSFPIHTLVFLLFFYQLLQNLYILQLLTFHLSSILEMFFPELSFVINFVYGIFCPQEFLFCFYMVNIYINI